MENPPRFDVSDRTLDWSAQAAHGRVKIVLPFKQFPVLGFLDRGNVAGPLVPFVADSAECCGDDFGGLRLAEGSHVVIVASDGLGDEYDAAREIRYNLAVEAGRLVLSRPEFRRSAPGPARRQEAVYQYCLAADGRLGLLGCGAKLRSGLLNERRDLGDDPGNSGLRSVEDLRPHVLDNILPRISRRDYYGISQGELSWTAGAAVPRILEERGYTIPEFVELLRVES